MIGQDLASRMEEEYRCMPRFRGHYAQPIHREIVLLRKQFMKSAIARTPQSKDD